MWKGRPRAQASSRSAYWQRQQRECEEKGVAWDPQGLVFPSEAGGQRDSRSVLRNFRSLLADAGFENPEEWTVRELRTSAVSLLSANRIPIEVIARVVGHSGTQTTERVYRKQIRPVITEGAEAMDDIFGMSTGSREETSSD
ncbi:tyrosine-type recombinase/integrase [Streptomyces sp. NPDC026206]|uniref:tyrosine-type recombinase/integrase n=1 Tax=Streptomyces sp. NPDC026206 TaxID=3157089 RepID=UPI00340456C2